ncbi:COX assembly mitochondrial protein 2 homolog [Styela clava]
MHPNLSPHLHTPECNEKIYALLMCRKQHPFKQYFGACNRADHEMLACFRRELRDRRKANYEMYAERKKSKKKVDYGEWNWDK